VIKLTLFIEPYSREAEDAANNEAARHARQDRIFDILAQFIPMVTEYLKAKPFGGMRAGEAVTDYPGFTSEPEPRVHTPPPPRVHTPPPPPPDPLFNPDGQAGAGPAPPDPATNARAKEESRRQAKLTEGYEAFASLVHLWMQNFDTEGPQPDRGAALSMIANGPLAGPVVTYVMACGGLTAAVYAVLPRDVHTGQRKLAENMAQVGSILFPELAQQLELIERKYTIVDQ
jgi:hypothetical protein